MQLVSVKFSFNFEGGRILLDIGKYKRIEHIHWAHSNHTDNQHVTDQKRKRNDYFETKLSLYVTVSTVL